MKDVKIFNLEQLQKGEVFYHHDGSNTTKDTFVLQAYDGYNVLNTIVDIHVRSKVSLRVYLSPRLLVSLRFHFKEPSRGLKYVTHKIIWVK